MNKMIREAVVTITIFSAFTIGLLVSPAPMAHGGAEGVIKERMKLMEQVEKRVRIIKAMIEGKTDYDAKRVSRRAREISKAGARILKLFPEGSGHNPSEALPAVWEQWKGFTREAHTLVDRAAYLAVVADDKQAVKSHFESLRRSCTSCHESYRKEEPEQ